MRSWIFFLLVLATGFLGEIRAQVPVPEEVKKPARLVVALAQPGEEKTTALQNGVTLWSQPSYAGYGLGEWTLPGGAYGWTIRHPERADLLLKGNLVGGDCYLITVDSKPNPDPKAAEKHPRVTVAELIPLKIAPPASRPLVYGLSMADGPLELSVNKTKLTLKKGELVKFSEGLAMIEHQGQILASSDPQDPCVILWVFQAGEKQVPKTINCRFF